MVELKKYIRTEVHLNVRKRLDIKLMCLVEHIKSANSRMKKPLLLLRINEIVINLGKLQKGLGSSDVG